MSLILHNFCDLENLLNKDISCLLNQLRVLKDSNLKAEVKIEKRYIAT